MAIPFITGGAPIDGYMLHRADPRNIQVAITHEPREGYILSYDGDVINEQMSLSEFMERLHRSDPKAQESHPERLQQDMRQVLVALSEPYSRKVQDVAKWLDRRYMNLIQTRTIILPQHNISMKLGIASAKTLESIGSREESMLQSELWDVEKVKAEMDRQGYMVQEALGFSSAIRKQPMTFDEAYRVSDDEVYYSIS